MSLAHGYVLGFFLSRLFFFFFSIFVHRALCKVRRRCGSLLPGRDEICCVGVCGEGRGKNTHINMLEDSFSLAAVIVAFFTSITSPISLGWIRAAMKDLRHVCAGDALAAPARHLPSPSNQRCFLFIFLHLLFFIYLFFTAESTIYCYPPPPPPLSYLLASAAACLRMWREGARRASHSTSGLSCIQMPGK